MPTKAAFRQACEAELGKPYIWGAQGPDAYDCSGLVQVMLEKLNLDPPGDQTAEGLYRHFLRDTRSTAVDVSESDLGDIVFFGAEESVSHVALAWGEQDMFEAGGGGRKTTTVAEARKHKAEVRIKPISRRKDVVAVLRPTALVWESEIRLEGAETGSYGHYQGVPETRWLPDGRHMQLLKPFSFIRTTGEAWPVPAEAIVDGASIPRIFWSLIGGPLTGLYRDASIVHDFYCDVKTRPWKNTHRIFFEGMMTSGVAELKAKIMYYAVYKFGPRWKLAALSGVQVEGLGIETEAVPAPVSTETFDAATFERDAAAIVAGDLSLEAIEALADAE